MIEARSVFRRRRFHRAKAHLVLSAMRHRAAEPGDRVRLPARRAHRRARVSVHRRLLGVPRPAPGAAGRQSARGPAGAAVGPARRPSGGTRTGACAG
nr:cryptochrome/photolyase family protein [Streptomyces sp. NA03103]